MNSWAAARHEREHPGSRPGSRIDRDPMVGPHPDHPKIHALTGGFKVSFGIAHLLADAVLDSIEGKTLALPHSFSLIHHVSVAISRPDDEEFTEIP